MANSSSVTAPMIPAPTTSSEMTGMSDTTVVLIERSSTWFIDSEVICEYVRRPLVPTNRSFSLILSSTTIVS